MPADDLTDPAPATTFAHLDATTVLSRSIAELGIYPAVDPLDSTSRMLSARILGQEHYDTARGVQRVLQVRVALHTLAFASCASRIRGMLAAGPHQLLMRLQSMLFAARLPTLLLRIKHNHVFLGNA